MITGSWLVRAAALVVVAALQVPWHLQPLPIGLRVLQLAAMIAALVRPAAGLVVLAALAPITTSSAIMLGAPSAGTRLLEQLVLACIAGALVHVRGDAGRTRLFWPALLVATAALTSLAAELPARLLSLASGAAASDLWRTWLAGYFGHLPLWEPLFYATLVAEGAALAWAVERIVRDHPRVVGPALAATLAGHVYAGWLNIDRLLTASLVADDPLGRARELLASLRFSIQYDKNAAGSVYAMVFFVALRFASASSRLGRAAAWAAMIVLAGAVAITGSRIAMLAIALGLFARLVLLAIRRPWAWALVAATVGAAAVGAFALSGFYGERTIENAVAGRQLLASAALRMTGTSPWFGIGVGTFFERSFEFGGEQMIVLVNSADPRENAHNNFLQVLAEQGATGLVAWVVLLGVGSIAALRRLPHATPGDQALVIGIAVFVITWLTGHPMLVPEAAFMFWLLLGVMTASLPLPAGPTWSWARRALAGAAIVLVAALPWRMAAERRAADLEHRGIGVSIWHHEGDMRYREAGSRFALYVPTDAPGVLVPVRRAPDAPDPIRLEIRANNTLINAVTIAGDDWHTVSLRLPPTGNRFDRADFTAAPAEADAATAGALLHIGRAQPLGAGG